MSRLFFALWPDSVTRAGLASVMDQLPPGCGRSVAHRNLHITLVFLGPLKEEQSQCVLAGARHIRMTPLSLILDKLGWWQRPQVIWLAPTNIPDALILLADKLRSLAGQCGISTDDRSFFPHATLVRKVRKRVTFTEITPITWQVRDYCLVSSETLPQGATYEVIWTSVT